MKSEFLLAFNQICSERGLPPEIVLDALKTALVSAYRRNANISSAQNVAVEIDQLSGQAEIFIEKEVVEEVHNENTEVLLPIAQKIDPDVQLSDTVMVEDTPKDFGRIAAQTAKQVILQRIREAEREALYEDFIGREGEIINGMVQSITPQHISINLGRTEAILPRKEQVRGERYTLHQRLRAYVVEVRRSGRGPQIIVSRNHKNMLRRLLELEVPEIYNGAVEIKSIAREAGARSKVAVAARQIGVDPVGSCVGMRGVRIQSIVTELGGEKIDVIEWSNESPVFIAKALSPARVLTVHLEESPENGRTATVIVPDDQLSLAIGREGQNARLAAKLTNWRIDIKSVTEAAREAVTKASNTQVQAALGKLADLLPAVAALLEQHIRTNTNYTTEQLLLLRQVIDQVHNYFATKRRGEHEAVQDKGDPQRAALEAREAQRRAEREQALAQIPTNAYEIPLAEMGLSTRVRKHLEKAHLENLGQVMERLVRGDEGLLALDGIGPKALTEIKTQIEEKAPVAPEEPGQAEHEVVAEAVAKVEPKVELAEPEEIKVPVQEMPMVAEAVVEEEADVKAKVAIEEEIKAAELARRAEREKALARIPTDAYDIPLEVLVLDNKVRDALREAQIDNLGQVMENLIDEGASLLALGDIDAQVLQEIKSQIEIMISVPEPVEAGPLGDEKRQQEPRTARMPRYEYVADEELEEKTKPKRRKKKKRQLVYDEDIGEVVPQKPDHFTDWDG